MDTYIFNIQKFSLHDGPGIRTTVFFKGCPLRCKWCHNPESQNFFPENMGEELAGQSYSVEELLKILKKDVLFYDQSGGGVTLSGGEVMAQDMEYVEKLLAGLQKEGISVTIDTCGQAPQEHFSRVLPYTDLFLYDLKMIDDGKHVEYTGVSNRQILENLTFLNGKGARIHLRLLMVKGVNMSENDIRMLAEWIKGAQMNVEKITLLPYHDFGRDKYKKLSRECTQNFEKPQESDLEAVQKILENYGFQVDKEQ